MRERLKNLFIFLKIFFISNLIFCQTFVSTILMIIYRMNISDRVVGYNGRNKQTQSSVVNQQQHQQQFQNFQGINTVTIIFTIEISEVDTPYEMTDPER